MNIFKKKKRTFNSFNDWDEMKAYVSDEQFNKFIEERLNKMINDLNKHGDVVQIYLAKALVSCIWDTCCKHNPELIPLIFNHVLNKEDSGLRYIG